ncbi:KxYKxGKxW signal peptide domain-containing protein [Periweissella cryptocerci]|uniref:KxYKxGKxW signal peptide domain-containing protein n=1 Tax=Periweissella cryptocerci TaxID=2506420 RepID=UPI0014046620|nr:KxYKxGKxW signal peptide domain-containing protein [Periweissella cryptocerci]
MGVNGTQKRFKLYKSGKNWLIAGIAIGGMALGTTASADVTGSSATTDASADSTQSTRDSAASSNSSKLVVVNQADEQAAAANDTSASQSKDSSDAADKSTDNSSDTATTNTNEAVSTNVKNGTKDDTNPEGTRTAVPATQNAVSDDDDETAQPTKTVNLPAGTSADDTKKVLADASAEYEKTQQPVTVTQVDATAPSSSTPQKATSVSGNVTTTDTTKIPADYIFMPLTNVGGTTVISNEGGTTEAKDADINSSWSNSDKGVAFKASDIKNGTTAVRISNVGYDDAGDLLDQIYTIKNFTVSPDITDDDIKNAGIRVNADSIDVEGLTSLQYTVNYVKSGTKTQVNLPGLVVLTDLDKAQSFTLSKADFNKVDTVYVPVTANGTNNVYEYKNSDDSVAFMGTEATDNTADGAVQLAMANVNGITFTYEPRDVKIIAVDPDATGNADTDTWHNRGRDINFGTPSIKYGISDTSTPKLTVSTTKLANTTASYTYKITQTVAASDKSSYYSTGSFTLTIDDGKTDSVKVDPSTIVIKDMMTGKMVTGLTPTIDGNTITFNLKSKLNSADFYGKRYEITIGATAQDKLQGDYDVKAAVVWTFNGDEESSKTVTTTVPAAKGQITVQYLSKHTGKVLGAPVTVDMTYGDTLNLPQINQPTGYSIDLPDSVNVDGTWTGQKLATYYYNPNEGVITVHYVNKRTGKKIAPDKTVAVIYDDPFTLPTIATPAGYTVDNGNAVMVKGTQTWTGQKEATFNFNPKLVTMQVEHIDDWDNILKTETVKGYVGDDYTLTPVKESPWYEVLLTKDVAKLTGEYSSNPKKIVLHYGQGYNEDQYNANATWVAPVFDGNGRLIGYSQVFGNDGSRYGALDFLLDTDAPAGTVGKLKVGVLMDNTDPDVFAPIKTLKSGETMTLPGDKKTTITITWTKDGALKVVHSVNKNYPDGDIINMTPTGEITLKLKQVTFKTGMKLTSNNTNDEYTQKWTNGMKTTVSRQVKGILEVKVTDSKGNLVKTVSVSNNGTKRIKLSDNEYIVVTDNGSRGVETAVYTRKAGSKNFKVQSMTVNADNMLIGLVTGNADNHFRLLDRKVYKYQQDYEWGADDGQIVPKYAGMIIEKENITHGTAKQLGLKSDHKGTIWLDTVTYRNGDKMLNYNIGNYIYSFYTKNGKTRLGIFDAKTYKLIKIIPINNETAYFTFKGQQFKANQAGTMLQALSGSTGVSSTGYQSSSTNGKQSVSGTPNIKHQGMLPQTGYAAGHDNMLIVLGLMLLGIAMGVMGKGKKHE